MTPTRYFVARLAQAFGYFAKIQRMADATSETILLRDAEVVLGDAIWQDVEPIEALGVEYWNLRKLVKERELIAAELKEYQTKFNQAQKELDSLLKSPTNEDDALLKKRLSLLTDLEEISNKRDQIIAEGQEIKRIHIGLKMKLEVISKESNQSPADQEEIKKVKIRLIELKKRFSELKAEQIEVAASIEKGDAIIDVIDQQIREKRQERRDVASETFHAISEENKNISNLRAKVSALDIEIRTHQEKIGHYVSRNTKSDPTCAAVVVKYQGLIDVMRVLRRSISLNQRLVGNN